MSDLRRLAEAVESTREAYLVATGDAWKPALVAYCNALGALSGALGGLCDDARDAAPAILAALKAERVRAMADVAEWCKTEARDEWRTWPRGPEYKSALADVARWAVAAGSAPPPVPQIQHPPASADSQQQGDDGEDV